MATTGDDDEGNDVWLPWPAAEAASANSKRARNDPAKKINNGVRMILMTWR